MRTFLLATLIAVAATAHAARIEVEVRPVVDGERCRAQVLTVDAEPGALALDVPGCWIEPVHVVPDTKRVIVRAWPVATVIGEVAFKPESAIPHAVTGSFVDADAKEPLGHPVHCAMDGKRWRCVVPARRALHLKVTAEGFVPLYSWDIDADEGAEETVGVHDLVRGGSVAGRVLTAAGGPAATAEVRIVPLAATEQAASERAAGTLRTRTNATGMFQIAGVAAGVYRVISTRDGFADATVEKIEVREDVESRLAAALVHVEMGRLDVAIQPPVSRAQQQWRMKLQTSGARLNEIRTVAEGTASPAGFWSVAKLQPGRYRLAVLDTAGSSIAEQSIDVRGGVENAFITVTAIEVAGRVVAGKRPVAVDLEFNRQGRRVRAKSNEEGRFTASFPSEGEWRPTAAVGATRVMLPAVNVEAGEELELQVPGGSVRGHVLDERGTAVTAMVTLHGEKHSIVAQVPTKDDGSFEVTGIDGGSYTIDAEAENATAGPVPLDVKDDEASEIELRVARQKKVRGTVFTARGTAASGATVRMFDPIMGTYETRITDAKGMFAFDVRGHAQVVSLIVLASPHPIATREAAAGEKDITIQLAPAGATLRVYVHPGPPWPTIRAGGGVPMSMLLFFAADFGGGAWGELVNGAFELNFAPGPHVVCFKDLPCESVQLAPGTVGIVDYSPARVAKEGK